MYCPNCGSQNQAEIKFCTRCGTNLSVVSEALTGRGVSRSQPDERMVKLLKELYDGRRNTVVGAASLTLGLIIIAVLMAAGMPDKWVVFGALGAAGLIYGAVLAIAGGAEWISASSELKALGIVGSITPLSRQAQQTPELAVSNQDALLKSPLDTDPIVSSASVTEHTTRQLEESDYRERLEKQSSSRE